MLSYFDHKKFWIFKKFLFFSKYWFNILSSSIKNKDILKDLNKIKSRKANENSNPAKPKIKNVIVTKFMSSFRAPVNIDNIYNDNQATSE